MSVSSHRLPLAKSQPVEAFPLLTDLFDTSGQMQAAIRPPDAIIPFRNGTESFSAASPPHYIDDGEGPLPNPEHPDTGRENNHGFEGLTVSDDGTTLWVLLQAATVQEGVSDIGVVRNSYTVH